MFFHSFNFSLSVSWKVKWVFYRPCVVEVFIIIIDSAILSLSVGEFSLSSVQLLICVWLFATPWTAACQASLSITNSQSLLKLMSIESVMQSNHFILCHPLLLLPSIFPSIRVFSNESALGIRWLKYWGFSFSISPSSEHSGLSSFRYDWFDLLLSKGLSRAFSCDHCWVFQFCWHIEYSTFNNIILVIIDRYELTVAIL